MRICQRCGVEVEEDARRCPLCGCAIHSMATDGSEEPAPAPRKRREAGRSIRRWVIELLSILALTGALVVLAVDLAADMSVSWALFPLAFIAFVWVSVTMGVLISRRTWVYLPAQTAAVCLFLYSLDGLTPGSDWFVPLALPVTLLTGTVLGLTLLAVRRLALSAFGSTIAAMAAAGVLAVGLELLINAHFHDSWTVSWSAVVFGCTLLLVVLAAYLRSWFRARQAELRKLLHL